MHHLLVLFAHLAAWPLVSSSQCDVDNLEICRCILGCEVFGSNADLCQRRTDHPELVHEETSKIPEAQHCDGMKCVVYCAQTMDCLGVGIKFKCQKMKEEDTKCDVNCNGVINAELTTMTLVVVIISMNFQWSFH